MMPAQACSRQAYRHVVQTSGANMTSLRPADLR